MEFKKILLPTVAFTVDTQDLNIPADNVKYLDIGLCSAQCGSTACNLATLPTILDEIQATLGGEVITRIHGVDLLALQTIWADSISVLEPGAGDGQLCHLMGLRLPVHVTKHGKSLTYRFTHADNANIDNRDDEITVSYQYREKPFASHFNYQYKEQNATTTFQEVNCDYYGCECIGVLLFATTVPTSAAANRSIDQVKVLVDDREVFHDSWLTMVNIHGDKGYGNVTDDADAGDLLEHYRWLDFQQEPLPAGKLRMLFSSLVATDLFRVVPVYIQPNMPAR